MWEAIDDVRTKRPGVVSRNTWIAEAILEKLAREQDTGEPPSGTENGHVLVFRIFRRRRHGARGLG